VAASAAALSLAFSCIDFKVFATMQGGHIGAGAQPQTLLPSENPLGLHDGHYP